MATPFTPGPLTTAQARALNEMQRFAEQFSRLSVAAPLSLTRAAGIPNIRIAGALGPDLLLAEVTAVTATTPPVHTVKRKTRDANNFVVDLTPLVTYTQVLNPLETVIPVGTIVAIFPIPEFEDWWWAIPIPEAAGATDLDCEPHGWLDDADALEDAADLTTGNDPPRVLRYWVDAGEYGGRCACIQEQFKDGTPAPFDGVAQAFWDGTGTHTWTGTRAIHTCCGCAIPVFTINGTALAPPKITGALNLSATCDSTAKTYDLRYHCAKRNIAIFAMSGPKICNSDPDPITCDNVAYITVLCDDCAIPNAENCDLCNETCTPSIIRVVITGLTNNSGDRTAYNGTWILEYDETTGCTWTTTCGAITITLTLSDAGGGNTRMTITGTGGAVGISDFADVAGLWPCFQDQSISIDQPNPSTAGTAELFPVYCEICPDKACGTCSQTKYDALIAGSIFITFSGGFAPDPNPVELIYSVLDGWWTATVNFCDREVDVIVKCVDLNNWSLTLQFHAIAGCTLTGPTDEVFTEVDCDPVLLLSGTFTSVNVSGASCSCATGDYTVIATVTETAP